MHYVVCPFIHLPISSMWQITAEDWGTCCYCYYTVFLNVELCCWTEQNTRGLIKENDRVLKWKAELLKCYIFRVSVCACFIRYLQKKKKKKRFCSTLLVYAFYVYAYFALLALLHCHASIADLWWTQMTCWKTWDWMTKTQRQSESNESEWRATTHRSRQQTLSHSAESQLRHKRYKSHLG